MPKVKAVKIFFLVFETLKIYEFIGFYFDLFNFFNKLVSQI